MASASRPCFHEAFTSRRMPQQSCIGARFPDSLTEGHTMTLATENRIDIAVTVASLAAEAVQLQNRVDELRQELANVDERLSAIAGALSRPCSDGVAVGRHHVSGLLRCEP
ncbi:hypothetical protein ABZ357_10295 [Streptomyces sp. NPDC005917]|uniref:hypothetical protein n=1 Tax=unclassified Streptomyces TaxID=2593676 RepID=UPI0033D6BB0A